MIEITFLSCAIYLNKGVIKVAQSTSKTKPESAVGEFIYGVKFIVPATVTLSKSVLPSLANRETPIY